MAKTLRHEAGDADVERYRRRLVSGTVAAAIGLIACMGVPFTTGWEIGYIGIPIAAVFGWSLALRLNISGSRTFRAILWMAFGCTLLGAYLVGVLATADPAAAILFGTLGLVIFGIPAFVLLLAPATAWAVITARLERQAP